MRRSDLDTVSELAMLANPFTTKKKYREHLLDELEEYRDLSFVAVENGKAYVVWDDENNTNGAGTDDDIFFGLPLTPIKHGSELLRVQFPIPQK